jgi:lysozyme
MVDRIEGADSSHWQGLIDFEKFKANGGDFVYIKVSQGIAYRDDRAVANNTAARAAGVKTGFYHFMTTDSALAQYNWMIQCIGDMPCDLAPALDYEAINNTIPTSSTLYTMANKLKGWRDFSAPAIYVAPGLANSKLINSTTVNWAQFLLWIANWNVTVPMIPTAWKGQPYYIWQDRVIRGAQAWGVDGDLDHDFWGEKLPFPGITPPPVSDEAYMEMLIHETNKVYCGTLKVRY